LHKHAAALGIIKRGRFLAECLTLFEIKSDDRLILTRTTGAMLISQHAEIEQPVTITALGDVLDSDLVATH